MARKPRVVAAGVPHHVTQRGNARADVFFSKSDRHVYLDTYFEYAERYGVRTLGFCLMSNHVHFVVIPEGECSLARVFGRTHSDYARYANVLRRGCGHLWQSRYYSCPVEPPACWRALAYVERNPVRAGMVPDAAWYPWSSARAHCSGEDPNGRIELDSWREAYGPERWTEVLRTSSGEEEFRQQLRLATNSGLPIGSDAFIQSLGQALGRDLHRRPPGRPPKEPAAKG